MIRYMAIDPGESTGMAWVQLPCAGIKTCAATTVAPNREAVYAAMLKLKPDVVILENFATGQRLNLHSRYTIELCGGVQAVCVMLGAKLVLHTPKHRYPNMDLAEEILIARHGPRGTTRKGAGTWTDHQQDALAHLCVYLERTVGVTPAPTPNPKPTRAPVRSRLRAAKNSPAPGVRRPRSPVSKPARTAR